MYRGYPTYAYVGIFEKEFGKEAGENIIGILTRDGLIEDDCDIAKDIHYYRLTKRGIDFALAMVNLNYSQKTYEFNKQLNLFTIILIILTIGTFVFSLFQLF